MGQSAYHAGEDSLVSSVEFCRPETNIFIRWSATRFADNNLQILGLSST